METTGLVQAFRLLQTYDSRNKALETLVNELTPYEWRTLHSMTSARSFQFDILGQLPLEITAHVFSYLDTTTPYRLQPVSRRWCHVLQSLHVLKKSLDSWFHGTVDLQGVDYTFCVRKAQTAHAFRTGNPRSHIRIYLNDPISKPILSGNTLMWKPSEGTPRMSYALDLSTRSLSVLRGEARENIRMIFASEHLAGFSTGANIFYAFELNGQGRKSFTVPNSQYFDSVSMRGRTVACAARFGNYISIYIWNFDTQQGKTFEIHRPSPLVMMCNQENHDRFYCFGIRLLVQPESESIVVLGDNHCLACHSSDMSHSFSTAHEKPQLHIMYSRFSYTGDCLESPRVVLTKSRFDTNENGFHPLGPSGVFGTTIRNPSGSPARVQFDEHLGAFTDPTCPLSEGSPVIPRYVNTWNGIFYRSSIRETHTGTDVLDFVETSDSPRLRPLANVSRNVRIADLKVDNDSVIVMNDRYVIRYGYKFFYALGFENSDKHGKESGKLSDIGTFVVDERVGMNGGWNVR